MAQCELELGGRELDRSAFNANRLKWIALELDRVRRIGAVPHDAWRVRPGRIDADRIGALPATGWRAMPLHGSWGGDRADLLWRTAVRIPNAFRGRSVRMGLKIGAEALVFLDGVAVQGLTPFHPEIALLDRARGGETLDLVLEAHSGWEHWRWSAPHGWLGGYHLLEQSEIFAVAPDVDALRHTVLMLSDYAQIPAADPGVVQQALRILKDLPSAVRPDRAFLAAVPRVLERLGRLRARLPRPLRLLAHAHLDVGYLWPKEEGIRKNARTLATACGHIERDPSFTFVCSQAYLLDELRRRYPNLYRRVQRAARTGRFELAGGMWVEADLNLTSGESLVRQLLYGHRFFEREFGVHSRVAWLPDAFGFGQSLPQLLRLADMDSFFTAKLNYAYPRTFPHTGFRWRGQDGSTVTGFCAGAYGGVLTPAMLAARAEHAASLPEGLPALVPYGYSDGGQGATPEMLGVGAAMRRFFGARALRSTTAAAYFRGLAKRRLPCWSDELYLNAHQGTYTTSAQAKRLNRRAEELLRGIEAAAAFAGWDIAAQTERLWKDVLVEQFHDLLPGSCVVEALEESLAVYARVFDQGRRLQTEALGRLFGPGAPRAIGLFNPVGCARNDYALVRSRSGAFQDGAGRPVAAQRIGRGAWLVAPGPMPAYGATVLHAARGPRARAAAPFDATLRALRTPLYHVRFERGGILRSLRCCAAGREALARPSNVFHFLVDDDTYYAAWDLVHDLDARVTELRRAEAWRIEDIGPLRATYFARRVFSRSEIRQRIHFYRDMPRIDFETEVDWDEDARMLKVAFHPDVAADVGRFENAFGFFTRRLAPRTIHEQCKFEAPHLRWADLSERDFGVALMNDGKHGLDFGPKRLRLTLLRSPGFPNPRIDRGRHRFTYSLLPHATGFAQSGVVERAQELNAPVLTAPGAGAPPPPRVTVRSGRFILDTIKRAEDSPALALRVYEPYGRATRGVLCAAGARRVWETNLLERPRRAVPCRQGEFAFALRPFEVKTFLVAFAR